MALLVDHGVRHGRLTSNRFSPLCRLHGSTDIYPSDILVGYNLNELERVEWKEVYGREMHLLSGSVDLSATAAINLSFLYRKITYRSIDQLVHSSHVFCTQVVFRFELFTVER